MASLNQVWQNKILVQQWDDGTSTYTEYDPTTGVQTLSRAYTAAETAAAQARATETTTAANLATIMQRIQTAISNNQTYLGLTSPTNAQNVAQVQALTRQCDGIMRVLGNILDSTN